MTKKELSPLDIRDAGQRVLHLLLESDESKKHNDMEVGMLTLQCAIFGSMIMKELFTADEIMAALAEEALAEKEAEDEGVSGQDQGVAA